jgi:AcrR family transcriptional regulator
VNIKQAAMVDHPLTPLEPVEGDPSAPLPKRRYGGASAQERQTQRRERLLEAAFDVFGTEGYANTTMRLICAKARLTERYFYENFDSLDQVFVAVHRKLSAELATIIIERRKKAAVPNPLMASREGLRAFLEYIKEDPRRARIVLTDALTTGLADVNNVDATVKSLVPFLRQRFASLFPNLDFEPDAELIANGLVGLIIQVSTAWVHRGFATPIDTVLDHIMYAYMGLGVWMSEHNKPPATK